ncbi:MAG: flagellar protein MotY [Thalassotalea sp.]
MKKPILLLSALCTLVALPSQANMRQYQADLENSMWQVSQASRLNCTLSHKIPNYGEAKFTSSASRKMNMNFELDMLRLPDSYSLAEVRSVNPSWKPGKADRILADMKLHKQFSPSLPKKIAWTMLSELEQGMNPQFFYDDWYDQDDKIAVGLSPARFGNAYREFVSCVGNLLNYNFDDIAYTVLNYQSNSDQLTKASKRRIDMITQYLSLDPELELVLVDAYTDSYGGRWPNYELSVKRANIIREYFVKSGIDPTRIEANGYGEKRHIASNNTVLGRGQNRRVVIRMDKP